MRRYRAILIAVLLVGIVLSSAAVAGRRSFGDASPQAGAAAFPAACENYAVAVEQLAQYASTSAHPAANTFEFHADPDPADTMKTLSDACDAEQATSR